MPNSVYIKFGTLTQLTCFIFLLKIGEMLLSYIKCQKVRVGSRLSQFGTKNLLAQTMRGKVFGTK